MPVVKFTNKVSVKPPHIHIKRQTEEFILYFVLSGEMYLKEGSREYALKPGDMLIRILIWYTAAQRLPPVRIFTYTFIMIGWQNAPHRRSW